MHRSAWFVAGAALLLATPASGQLATAQAPDRTAEIDRIFAVATAETPGCAVGVSQHGRTIVNRAYGLADVERRLPLSERAVFDIGSTQKQFVAAAVLRLVEDGRLALTDDIRKHVPELPDYGHAVTVNHLLTHTSASATGRAAAAGGGGRRRPAADPAPARPQLHARRAVGLLEQRLRAAEGDRRRASGTSFAEFARRRLFEPLGMKSSAYVADILHGTGDRASATSRRAPAGSRTCGSAAGAAAAP
jgi:CubicO group peptidase (beta-lactamase class C family)